MSIICHITLLLLHSCTPGFSVAQDGIVDSKVSIPQSRAYMVYILDSELKAVCSGFLVREDFVMTVASCNQSHPMYLGINDTNLFPDGVTVHPFPHPEFNDQTPSHDIMLLKLKTPANLNKNVHTITLPKNSSENISKDCIVMGWDLQKYHNESSRVLKEANVTLLDSENCGTIYTLCSKGTSKPAMGDGGSLLVCGDVALGILSYCEQESNGEYCTRYTDISQFLPWIYHVMNSHPLQKNESTKGKLEEHEVIKFNTICLV